LEGGARRPAETCLLLLSEAGRPAPPGSSPDVEMKEGAGQGSYPLRMRTVFEGWLGTTRWGRVNPPRFGLS